MGRAVLTDDKDGRVLPRTTSGMTFDDWIAYADRIVMSQVTLGTTLTRGQQATRKYNSARWQGYFGYLIVRCFGSIIEVRQSSADGVYRMRDRALTEADAEALVSESLSFLRGERPNRKP